MSVFELIHILDLAFELSSVALQLVCCLPAFTNKCMYKTVFFPPKVNHADFFPIDLDCL